MNIFELDDLNSTIHYDYSQMSVTGSEMDHYEEWKNILQRPAASMTKKKITLPKF